MHAVGKLVELENLRKMLKWMAGIMPYSNPADFDSNMTVAVYFDFCKGMTIESVKQSIFEMSKKLDRMPTPKEFSEFLGHVPTDTATMAQAIYGQIRRTASGEPCLSKEAEYVMDELGTSVWDLKTNMRFLESITPHRIETILKAKPIQERNNKQLEESRPNQKLLIKSLRDKEEEKKNPLLGKSFNEIIGVLTK